MVREQLEARGIRDPRVLDAMRRVPRSQFVGEEKRQAYGDHPLPIGHGQTISQPYIVGLMTELADIKPQERVLEVGTGSGYQTAVLAFLGAEVWSVEIVPELAELAKTRLAKLGYAVHVKQADGYEGWPEHAPYDAIVVTAAPGHIPPPLLEQLAEGGRLVLPVGDAEQRLLVIRRTSPGYEKQQSIPVRFVPMTGQAEN